MKPIVIFCSVPSREVGESISRLLVEQSLVACAQLIPGITSIYRWENKICEESECLMVLKSTESNYKDVEHVIKTNHPYEIPEIVGFDTNFISSKYLDWMNQVLKV